MRLLICIFVLTAGASFVFGVPVVGLSQKPGLLSVPVESAVKSTESRESVVILLTGNELGALQPCGCSGGQLGGLDRRAAVFNSVPASGRLIVDTGSFVESDGEQDLIKFNIVLQALGLLGYDLVNLTAKDVEIARNLGLLETIGSGFGVISSAGKADANVPVKFTKRYAAGDGGIYVTVAAVDAQSGDIGQAAEFFTPPACTKALNILILEQFDDDSIASVSSLDKVDCVVCPSQSDEPLVISEPNERPLLVSIGRYGKYVGKLQITFDQSGKKKLTFSTVAVTEDLPREKSLVELYKAYQQLVKEVNLLEQYPRFILPDGLEYANSLSCKPCHEYEYQKWGTRAHSKAYETLEKVGSQFDPECVICHVVGLEYETGFVSGEETADLENVGCENCHGPGSEHNATLGKAETTEPKSQCADCHTPEHSADYQDNDQLYLEKIIHWKEPNAPGSVKE